VRIKYKIYVFLTLPLCERQHDSRDKRPSAKTGRLLQDNIFEGAAVVVIIIMIVGFTTIFTIRSYHQLICDFESCSWQGVPDYVIKFESDLR